MQPMISMGEAASYLGVSTVKMWKLVNAGTLETFSDPLDDRRKLVRVKDLDALKRVSIRAASTSSKGARKHGTDNKRRKS
jgi:hypothetical protein